MNDALNIITTTAGSNCDCQCYDEYLYACKVRDGIIEDDTYFPLIYEWTGKWDDWRNYKKSNPALKDGLLSIETLKNELKRTK